MSEQRVLAVMYHYVRERAGTPEAAIHGLDASAFERQIDRLCECLEPITWPTFQAWRRGEASIPNDCVMVTFDDGLADHAEIVAPLLEQRGLRGIFFVPGHVLNGNRIDSAQQIHVLQARLGDGPFAAAVLTWLRDHPSGRSWADKVDLVEARRVYHYESPDRAFLKYLLSHTLPIDLRNEMIDGLFAAHVGDPQDLAADWHLDAECVAALAGAGHTVGGHGFDHEPYLRLSSDDQLRDLARTAARLSEILGPGLRPFSYPYGSFNESVAWRCAEMGFVHGFTTRPSWIRPSDPPFALGRLDTINVEYFLEQELPCPSSCTKRQSRAAG